MKRWSDLPFRLKVLRLGFQTMRAVSPDLALRLAERIFSTPRRHRMPEVELAALHRGQSTSIRANGLRLRMHTWGEGPAVLLLHGWEGRGAQFHAFLDPLIEAGFSAIAFDQPGHGHSEGHLANPLIWREALEAVASEIGQLHGVVAHSLGAVGAAMAMTRGLDVSRAVFISPPLEPDPYYSGLLSALGLPENAHQAAFHAFAARLGIPWDQARLRSLASRLSSPLLVIHDRDDREIPWSSIAALAPGWPSARFYSTEGLGHRRILRDPAVVRQAVAFLSSDKTSAVLPFHGDGPRSLEWNLFHRDLRSA